MEWIEETFSDSDSFVALVATNEGAEIVTSLLFTLATHISGKNGCVTMIKPQPPAKAPLLPSGWKPHVNHLRRVEFLYMTGRRELVTFITKLHALGAMPDCIMIDGLNYYSNDCEIYDLTALLALLEDLCQWIQIKRTHNSLFPITPVVVSFTASSERLDQVVSTIGLYTDQVWRLQIDDNDPSWFNLKHGKNGRLRIRVNEDGTTFDSRK